MTLREFLKQKRTLVKFRANCRLDRTNEIRTKTEAEAYITEKATFINAIVSAFTWGKTPEGYDYWDDLDNAWTLHVVKRYYTKK